MRTVRICQLNAPLNLTDEFTLDDDGYGHLVRVLRFKENDEFVCRDEFTYEDTCIEENLLKPIFIDGKMVKEESLSDIRNRLNNNQF